MKEDRILKITLSVLVLVLITLISFCGVYFKDTAKYTNKINSFSLGMDFKGYRLVQLKPSLETDKEESTETNEVVPEEGEVNNSEDESTEEKDTITEVKTYTADDYKKFKGIIEDRLKTVGIPEYNVSVNEENGVITIKAQETNGLDAVLNSIILSGKFEFVDKETKEVLLNNTDIKKVTPAYAQQETGTVIYVDINFNKAGTKKLADMTNAYTKTTIENTIDNSISNEIDNSVVGATIDNSINNEIAPQAEENTTEITKEVTLNFNGEEYLTTHFDEPISDGRMQLTLGSASTDNAELQKYLEEASTIATLLNSDVLDLDYTVETNQHISSSLFDFTKVLLLLLVFIITGLVNYLIVQYKERGILGGVLLIGFTACLLLIARYTDILITVNSILMILFVVIIEYLLIKSTIKQLEAARKDKDLTVKVAIDGTLKKYVKLLIPVAIVAIVFTLNKLAIVNSIGKVLFWGSALFELYNLIFVKTIFSNYEDIV